MCRKKQNMLKLGSGFLGKLLLQKTLLYHQIQISMCIVQAVLFLLFPS